MLHILFSSCAYSLHIEGEQFANAFFDTKTKIAIAKALDAFGVEYLELTSPAASEQSRLDCEAICKLGLKAKILTHIRCHMDDARIAVETGALLFPLNFRTSAHLVRCRWCRCCYWHILVPSRILARQGYDVHHQDRH